MTMAGTPGRPDLLSLLATVGDPRARRGVRHPLPAILAVGLAAVLAGARSFVAIGEWVACQSTHTLTQLGVSGQGPDESTIRRTFSRLEADVLDLMTAWIERYRRTAQERYRRLDDVLRAMDDGTDHHIDQSTGETP